MQMLIILHFSVLWCSKQTQLSGLTLFFHLDETSLSLRRLEAHPLLPPPPPRRPMDSHIVPPVSHRPPKRCTLSGFCPLTPCSSSGWPQSQPAPRPQQMGWEYARPSVDPAGAQGSRGWALGGGGAAESPEGRPGGPAAVASSWGVLQGGPALSGGRRRGGRREEEWSSDLHCRRTPRCEPGERRIRLPLWEKEMERQEADGWRAGEHGGEQVEMISTQRKWELKWEIMRKQSKTEAK